MKFLKALLLLISLALMIYAARSVFAPDHQAVTVDSESTQPDSVVVGVPERLIDAALRADSSGIKSSGCDGNGNGSPSGGFP